MQRKRMLLCVKLGNFDLCYEDSYTMGRSHLPVFKTKCPLNSKPFFS